MKKFAQYNATVYNTFTRNPYSPSFDDAEAQPPSEEGFSESAPENAFEAAAPEPKNESFSAEITANADGETVQPPFLGGPNDRDRFLRECIYGSPTETRRNARKPNDRDAFIAECLAVNEKTDIKEQNAAQANANEATGDAANFFGSKPSFDNPAKADKADSDALAHQKDSPDFGYLEPPPYFKKTEPKFENYSPSKYYSYILKHNAALQKAERGQIGRRKNK